MSTYHKQLRNEFRQLTKSIPTSQFPLFEAEVAKLAWNITEEAAAVGNKGKGRRLSLSKIFYVYVLMDPRKPGPWVITFPGGMTFELPFLPFYVGKGHGNRIHAHVRYLDKALTRSKKPTRKQHTILNIKNAGLQVVEQKVSVNLVEAVALAKEEMLIRAVGRADKKEGPLANLSDGREGPTGTIWTAAARKLASIQSLGRKHTRATKQHLKKINTGKSHTTSTKQKISESKTGVPVHTEEGKKAIGDRSRGIPRSVETRTKIGKGNRGKKVSEESKAKMRKPKSAQACKNMSDAAKTRKPPSAETRAKFRAYQSSRPRRRWTQEEKDAMSAKKREQAKDPAYRARIQEAALKREARKRANNAYTRG